MRTLVLCARSHSVAFMVTLLSASVMFVDTGHAEGKAGAKAAESSVVKVYVQTNSPDLVSPWQKLGPESGSGSGVIIDDHLILTNAHVVTDAVSIEVKRSGMSKRYQATIVQIGHDVDLALIEVQDDTFFDGARQMQLGEMPKVEQEVQVLGFPLGGEKLSVTSGIISRIEVGLYLHSMEEMLLAQVDAAINSGNSGGPVLANDALVGIATQGLDDAENIGYMVPVSVIQHFLKDVSDGLVDGVPRLGAAFQPLESGTQRAALGLKEDQTGTLITEIDHGSPAFEVLQPGDVLLSIEGNAVANDGTVAWPEVGRVDLSEVYSSKQIGESVSVSILRDGQPVQKEIRLTPHRSLVPGRYPGSDPEYLVFGGLVFQSLTMEYLWYFEELPSDLTYHAADRNVTTPSRHQVIVLQVVLPHAVNRGYQEWEDVIVDSVNGIVPRDMKHFAEVLDSADGQWLQITTENRSVLTLDVEAARAARGEILDAFGIARDRSEGLGG